MSYSKYLNDAQREEIERINPEISRLMRHKALEGGYLTEPQEASLEGLLMRREEIERAGQLAGVRARLVNGEVRGENGVPHGTTSDPYRDEPRNGSQTAEQRIIDDGKRAIERFAAPDEVKHHAMRTLESAKRGESGAMAHHISLTTDPNYRSAFSKLMSDPENGHREFSDAELRAFRTVRDYQRAMSLSDSAGGFLVPADVDFAVQVQNSGTSGTPMRQIAKVRTTARDQVSILSSAGVSTNWYAEAAEVSDDSPTLAEQNIPVYRASSFVAASLEVADDSQGLTETLSELFADAKRVKEEGAFISGTGSGQPTGLVTALVAASPSVTKVASGTNGTIVMADVTGLQSNLPARYQDNAGFLMNKAVANYIRTLDVSTKGSAPLVQFGSQGLPGTVLGDALYLNSNMDGTVASAANHYNIVYGDFRNYVIVDRLGLTVEYIPHIFGSNRRPTGTRGWFAYWRVGADSINDNAFEIFNCKNA